jgi:hypothetical protein
MPEGLHLRRAFVEIIRDEQRDATTSRGWIKPGGSIG